MVPALLLVVNVGSLSSGLKGRVALSPAKHLDLQTAGDSVQDEYRETASAVHLSGCLTLPRHEISLVPSPLETNARFILRGVA